MRKTNGEINDRISPVWWNIINNVKWKSFVTSSIFLSFVSSSNCPVLFSLCQSRENLHDESSLRHENYFCLFTSFNFYFSARRLYEWKEKYFPEIESVFNLSSSTLQLALITAPMRVKAKTVLALGKLCLHEHFLNFLSGFMLTSPCFCSDVSGKTFARSFSRWEEKRSRFLVGRPTKELFCNFNHEHEGR